jgi:hypothetical protein
MTQQKNCQQQQWTGAEDRIAWVRRQQELFALEVPRQALEHCWGPRLSQRLCTHARRAWLIVIAATS